MHACRVVVLVAVCAATSSACPSSDPAPPSAPQAPETDRDPAPAEHHAPVDDDHYVVAPEGDDGASGSAAAPWKTLQGAAAEVGPGDTVIVRAGRYDGFELGTSGTPNEPIRFKAQDGVVIDEPSSRDGINLEGASHVHIRGFRVQGASRAGIRAVKCEHVKIRDNVLDRNDRWGILTGFCDDLTITGNEASRSRDEHGIYVGNTSERPHVADNEIWGNRLAGIHMNGDVHMGGEGVISGARITGNVIRENGAGGASGINLDGVQDSLVANNLLYENTSAGIALYRIDGGGPSTQNVVVHNTVVMARGNSRWALSLSNGAQQNAVYNNILLAGNPQRGAIAASSDSLPGLRSDANLITDRLSPDGGETVLGLEAWRSLTGQDDDSSPSPSADELFADPGAGDFKLAKDSPARGAGKPLSAALGRRAVQASASDLAGVARPSDGPPDPGCYQMSQDESAKESDTADATDDANR